MANFTDRETPVETVPAIWAIDDLVFAQGLVECSRSIGLAVRLSLRCCTLLGQQFEKTLLGMPPVGNDSLLQPSQSKLMRNVSRMRLDSEQRLKIASFQFKGVFRLQFSLPTRPFHHANGTQNEKTRQVKAYRPGAKSEYVTAKIWNR